MSESNNNSNFGAPGWRKKSAVLLPAKDNRGKVNIQPPKFEELVDKQGVRVKVYRTTFCPNVKSIDGAEHEIDCALCHGSQFVDCYPIETWAFIQSQDQEKHPMPEGLYDGNTVRATFMQGVELQYFTLVELMDFTEVFFERVKRQEGKIDVLKYPAKAANFLIDQRGIHYTEGSDYNIDHNGNVSWCPNKGPDADTIYSIHYETLIRFRATKANHVNRFVQIATQGHTQLVKMNEQWLLQKEYLVVRKDIDGNLLEPNKIRSSDEE